MKLYTNQEGKMQWYALSLIYIDELPSLLF